MAKPVELKAPQDLGKRDWIRIILLFFTIGFLFYGNTMWNGYSMDDELVTGPGSLPARGVVAIPKIIRSYYSVNEKQSYEYRPIVLISFAIEHQLFGVKPGVSHFINVLLYVITCLVLFKFLQEMFWKYSWQLSFIAAFIFLVHPIHSEVVASLKNRDEILALLLGLFSLRYVIRFRKDPGLGYLFLAIAFFLLSALAKRSTMTFMAIIPILYVVFDAGKMVEKRKVVVLLLSTIALFLLSRFVIHLIVDDAAVKRDLLFFENPLYVENVGISGRLIAGMNTLGFYLAKFIVPYPLLSYYGYNTIEVIKISPFFFVISCLFIVISFFVLFRIKSLGHPLIFGLVFFGISISMFLNVVVPAVGIVAERFLFLPSVGLSLSISWLLLFVTKKYADSLPRVFIRAVSIGLVLVFFIIVFSRNGDWKDRKSLYIADVTQCDKSAKQYSLLGAYYATDLISWRNGQLKLDKSQVKNYEDSSLWAFQRALEIYPEYAACHNNIGSVYYSQRFDLDSSESHFRSAVKIDTNYAQAFFNLANVEFIKYKAKKVQRRILARYLKTDFLYDTLNYNPDKKIAGLITQYNGPFLGIAQMNPMIMPIVKGMLTSQNEQQLEGKFQNIKNVIKVWGPRFFHSRGFPVSVDSLYASIEKGLMDYLYNKSFGAPEDIIDNAMLKSCLPLVFKFVAEKLGGNNSSLNLAIQLIDNEIKELEKEAILHLNLALRGKPDFLQAFDRLNSFFFELGMADSVIALSKRNIDTPGYLVEQLYLNIGNGYNMKSEVENGIVWFKKGAELDIQYLNKLAIVINQMSATNYVLAYNPLYSFYNTKRKEVFQSYSIISDKYKELGKMDSAQYFYQLSMNYR